MNNQHKKYKTVKGLNPGVISKVGWTILIHVHKFWEWIFFENPELPRWPKNQKTLRMRLSIDHNMDVQHQVAGSQTS